MFSKRLKRRTGQVYARVVCTHGARSNTERHGARVNETGSL
ncbi:hypothetical protein STXM2123_2887 [Streptomyces sp. F-3]|nr:hypothetical protein STXM2123_2887 [Streptomyces sp. F-3]